MTQAGRLWARATSARHAFRAANLASAGPFNPAATAGVQGLVSLLGIVWDKEILAWGGIEEPAPSRAGLRSRAPHIDVGYVRGYTSQANGNVESNHRQFEGIELDAGLRVANRVIRCEARALLFARVGFAARRPAPPCVCDGCLSSETP